MPVYVIAGKPLLEGARLQCNDYTPKLYREIVSGATYGRRDRPGGTALSCAALCKKAPDFERTRNVPPVVGETVPLMAALKQSPAGEAGF